MGAMADLDIFIKQHCKEDAELEKRVTNELSDHFDGAPISTLSEDSMDILDAWTVYCNELDKKIAH